MSSGNTQKQIQLMHDFGAKGLACTPSYALYLAETIHQSGIPLEEFQLRVGAFGAEPWTENMRKELETKLNIKAYDIYGLTEIAVRALEASVSAERYPPVGRPFLPGDRGPEYLTTGGTGTSRRVGLHHAYEGGYADASLPYT